MTEPQLRPRDVPFVQRRMIDLWDSDIGMALARSELAISPTPQFPSELFCHQQVKSLNRAELMWVSSDMCELWSAAADTLPPCDLDISDIPALYGLVVLARPIIGTDAEDASNFVYTSAISWSVVDIGHIRSIAVNAWCHLHYYDVDSIQRRRMNSVGIKDWYYLGSAAWPLGTNWDNFSQLYTASDEQQQNSIAEDRRLIACLFRLLSQPLALQTDQQLDRHAIKQLKRRATPGTAIPEAVRVINLRTPSRVTEGATPAGREYSHRFMVHGFWRQQWHPTLNKHVPTWIDGYIKGPADKPLIIRPTVRAWRR